MHFTDFLNELLKSRKKKTDAFKAAKSKGKINDFELSDDEGKRGRTKRVSFLKTQRVNFPSEDATASESHENEPEADSISGHNNSSYSLSSQHSTNVSDDNTSFKNSGVECTGPQVTRESSCKSASYPTSDDTLTEMSLAFPSESSVMETPGPELKGHSSLIENSQNSHLSASNLKHVSSAGLFHVQATQSFVIIYKTASKH